MPNDPDNLYPIWDKNRTPHRPMRSLQKEQQLSELGIKQVRRIIEPARNFKRAAKQLLRQNQADDDDEYIVLYVGMAGDNPTILHHAAKANKAKAV